MSTSNSTAVLRTKRDESLVDYCKGLKYRSIMAEATADIANDINALPGVDEALGSATAFVSATAHASKGKMEMERLSLGCDDIPFNEIKDIVKMKFGELKRMMDFSEKAMGKVTEMVSKTSLIVETTRLEMQRGFDNVINGITDDSVIDRITTISRFAGFFNVDCKRISGLKKDKYVAKLQEKNGILDLIKDSREVNIDTLYSAMSGIIINKNAIPKDANDSTAFKALFALFYGAQTYVAAFGFLIKSHSYLADYYYQNGKLDEFNEEFDKLRNVFVDFKTSLGGKSSGFIMEISNTLEKVKSRIKDFNKEVDNKLYMQIADKSKLITDIQNELDEMSLPLIREIPNKPSLTFEKPDVNVPIGMWIEGAVVKYAVQYEKEGRYSKLSNWSDQLEVNNKAFPTIKVIDALPKVNRLIFRQFDNNPPELVGILGPSNEELRDKDRDLYNAAGEIDKDLGLEEVKLFITNGANVTAVFELGRTPLHNAAKFGNDVVFSELCNYLTRNVSYFDKSRILNVRDRKGWTPLHVAAEAGRNYVIKTIIDNSGDISKPTLEEGYTVFHIAAREGSHSVSKALREYASKSLVDKKDRNGFTALHISIINGKAFLNEVLDKNPDVNAKSSTGLTPAHLAAIHGNFNYIMSIKVGRSLNINAVDVNNLTPLHYAAIMGNHIVIKNILKMNKSNANMQLNKNKWTPLHYAIFLKRTDAARELIKHPKTDKNAKAMNDVTPLHFAASTGQIPIVEALLKEANIEAKTDQGETALHLAAIRGCERCVQLLVETGNANRNAKTNDNKTALELALKYNKNLVADYLNSKGGKRFRKNVGFKSTFTQDRVLDQGMQVDFIKKLPASFTELLERRNAQIAITASLPIDANATLLLLHVVLRKLTNEKYTSTLTESVSELDAQLKALDIIKQFEKFMNMMISVPVEELIDLAEVASEVKKALMGGRGNEVVEILCSFSKMVHELKPDDLEYLMKSFLPTKVTVPEANSNVSDEVVSLLKNKCPA